MDIRIVERFANRSAIRRLIAGRGRAQAAVEFAIILTVALIVLVIGVQFAIIGNASLALGQADYQGARWAAINPSANQSQVNAYILSVASPTIAANNGSYLTTTLSPAPPCAFGSSVTVSLTFNVQHLIAVPNPFLGISFPTSLSNSESAFCEG